MRLLLALLIGVGITTFVVWKFYDRIVALSAGDPWPPEEPGDGADESEGEALADGTGEPAPLAVQGESDGDDADDDKGDDGKKKRDDDDDDDDDDAHHGKAPRPFYLAGRIMAITTTAFVFLLAFTLNNFWGNAQDARVAVEEEGADFQSAMIASQQLPDGPFKVQLQTALKEYAQGVVNEEWPLLEQADSVAALETHRRLGRDLASVTVLTETPPEVAKTPAWTAISSTIPDMLNQGTQRIHQLPRPQAPNIVGLIFLLAVLNLAVTAAYQPARPKSQNVFLMGLMAGIVTLMLYILVEASNPFTGAGAVLPNSYGL